METELKRCRDCGNLPFAGHAKSIIFDGIRYYYECEPCQSTTGWYIDQKKAAESWNKNFGEDASRIINGERQDSFELVADRWQQYIETKCGTGGMALTVEDAAFRMVDFKLVREMVQQKRDNLIDAAGYLGIMDDIKNGE